MTLNGHFALKFGPSSASNGLAFRLSEKSIRKFAELRIYCQRNKKCIPATVLMISVMGLFTGVTRRGSVKPVNCIHTQFSDMLFTDIDKKVQQSWQTSALAMHLPLARLVFMPVIFCLLPSSSIIPEYLRDPELSIDNFRRQLKTFPFAQYWRRHPSALETFVSLRSIIYYLHYIYITLRFKI